MPGQLVTHSHCCYRGDRCFATRVSHWALGAIFLLLKTFFRLPYVYGYNASDRSIHTQLAKMSFDEIFDPESGV